MKRFYLVLLLLISNVGHACKCLTFVEAQKKAATSNKFILVDFGSVFYFEDQQGVHTTMISTHGIALVNHYVCLCLPFYQNEQYYKKYNVKKGERQLLLIDRNGKELYRFLDVDNSKEFTATLENFILPNSMLTTELNNFHKKESYNTALRVAQKYLDFSLAVDPRFKKKLYDISQLYLNDAKQFLTKKDSEYLEKVQKLELMQLYHWAYERNFALLDEKLKDYSNDTICQNNLEVFYFLKYITAKGLNNEEYPEVEARTNQIDGFDSFVKKADIILSQQV
jgi:hypothetical protein